uniref:lysine-specific demethylase JMJ25-like n=1 Tax=Erigeron canadensis TaxID=72917 RepID=UPI001CB8CAC5|nr:lysine-specific demethylase JMJ25-like [Erigeron canadensis]
MPKRKTNTSKNASNTKKQVVGEIRQKAVNVGNGVKEKQQQQNCCHQCGDKGKDDVIDCKKCGSERYCVHCKSIWYPDVSMEEFAKACPVCCNNCNCNTCLRGLSLELLQVLPGYSCSEPDKIQYSKQLLQQVYPLLKKLYEESQIENEIEAEIKASSSDEKSQNYEFEVADDITCDNCGAYFFCFCGSCTQCGYDLCIACLHELCDGSLKWKCRADGSIPCPPIDLGGCDSGKFKLKHVMLFEDVEEMLKKAQGIYEMIGSDDILETSTKCSICCDSSNNNMQEKSNANCLYSPSAKDIQGQDVKHFQWHWSKGEPIIVSDVLVTSSGLSWEPMVLWRAFSDIKNSGDRPRAYKVNAFDCSNGKEVAVYLHDFLRRYSEGGFYRKKSPTLLKLENWQPPSLSQGEWPRHFAEFISCLPFKEYTHPHNGYFNVASKFPDVSSELDMGPRMDMAYGVEEELKSGDSVTKLHCDMSDTVNVLTHTKSAYNLSAKLNKKNSGKRKHCDQDRASVSEEGDSMVEGALWDVFPRQDITKLKKYLWKHSADFKLGDCPSAEKVFFPIHDNSFYLNTEHKRKLKEEFGIEPWTYKQKLGDAVLIPAGCPYQVRNLKSCTKVELNFFSPESLRSCILMQGELRKLPNNNKARQKMQNIGKMMICALKRALTDICSKGPIDDLQFPNDPEINIVSDDGENNFNHRDGWMDDCETGDINHDDLRQEMVSNEWIILSSSSSQNESPSLHTTDHVVDQEPASNKNATETEGTYRGHAVGVAEKELLEAFELHYPNAFKWARIGSGSFWPAILIELYNLIKVISETSVEELVDQEQITRLEDQVSGLKIVGFDLSWIEKRLHMVKEVRFGDYPLNQDLLELQESIASLKEEMNERQRKSIEAQLLFEKAQIKYAAAKKARNKLHEMTQKYGDGLVLAGRLGSGMFSSR